MLTYLVADFGAGRLSGAYRFQAEGDEELLSSVGMAGLSGAVTAFEGGSGGRFFRSVFHTGSMR